MSSVVALDPWPLQRPSGVGKLLYFGIYMLPNYLIREITLYLGLEDNQYLPKKLNNLRGGGGDDLYFFSPSSSTFTRNGTLRFHLKTSSFSWIFFSKTEEKKKKLFI